MQEVTIAKKTDRRYSQYIADFILFLALLAISGFFLYRLVICQVIYAGRSDGYPSDVVAYIMEIQGTNTEYNFAYPLFFLTGKFFNLFLPIGPATAVSVVLYNGLSMILLKKYFENLLIKTGRIKDSALSHIVITLAVFGCCVMSMWWLPRFGKYKLPHKDQVYAGTLSGNPWHNATYIATKPFSIVAFFSFSELLSQYENKIQIKTAVTFAISLMLSAVAKPTFNLVLISAAGTVMLVRFIRSRFKNFKQSVLLGCCFFPTFAVMLIQYADMFGSTFGDDVQGIRFCWFEVWKIYNPHVLEAVFYANVTAVICLFFFAKDLIKDTLYRFTTVFFLISFLEAGLICERGKRFVDFNFGWGYMHGIFFFQSVSAIKLIEATFSKRFKWYWTVLLWVLFLSQIVAGILYFKGLYYGRDYRTLLPATWT